MFDNELFLREKVENILQGIIEDEFDYNIKLNIDYNECANERALAYFEGIGDNREIRIFINNFINFNYSKSVKDILFYKFSDYITDMGFVRILLVIYHECFHAHIRDNNSLIKLDKLDCFKLYLEDYVRSNDYSFYLNNYSLFWEESLADLYGIIKTSSFLKDNYPNIYWKRRKILDSYLKKIKQKIICYDINYFYDEDIKDIIHDNNGNFLSVKSIYDIYINCGDDRICYTIITFNSFLKKLDISTLSEKEKEIMLVALEFSYNQELLKKNYILNKFKGINVCFNDFICWDKNVDYLLISNKRLKYLRNLKLELTKNTKVKNLINKYN